MIIHDRPASVGRLKYSKGARPDSSTNLVSRLFNRSVQGPKIQFLVFLTLVACRPHRCFLALSSPRLSRQSLDDSPDQALLAKLGDRRTQTRASRQDSVKNADLRISSDFRGNPRYRASIAPPQRCTTCYESVYIPTFGPAKSSHVYAPLVGRSRHIVLPTTWAGPLVWTGNFTPNCGTH